MKKVLAIVVLGLLWSIKGFAATVDDFIKPGMTKQQVKKITNGTYNKKAKELTATNANSGGAIAEAPLPTL